MPNCIFCGYSNLTKEHLWGQWLIKVSKLEHGPKDKVIHSVSELGKTAPLESKLGMFDRRNGTELHLSRRLVCAKCNNEWMSGIENDAMGVLKPSFQFEKINWNDLDNKKIGLWGSLKAVLFYEALIDDTQLKGRRFRNIEIAKRELLEGKIPADFVIYVCNLKQPWIWGWHHLKYGSLTNLSSGHSSAIFSFSGAVGPLGFIVSNWPDAHLGLEEIAAADPFTMRPLSYAFPRIQHKIVRQVSILDLERMLYFSLGKPETFRSEFFNSEGSPF